jgi:hypothetical protein
MEKMDACTGSGSVTFGKRGRPTSELSATVSSKAAAKSPSKYGASLTSMTSTRKVQ